MGTLSAIGPQRGNILPPEYYSTSMPRWDLSAQSTWGNGLATTLQFFTWVEAIEQARNVDALDKPRVYKGLASGRRMWHVSYTARLVLMNAG